jgi:hypothetical protein
MELRQWTVNPHANSESHCQLLVRFVGQLDQGTKRDKGAVGDDDWLGQPRGARGVQNQDRLSPRLGVCLVIRVHSVVDTIIIMFCDIVSSSGMSMICT